MTVTQCRRCGASIRFVEGPTGQLVMLDARPSRINGFVLLRDGKPRVLGRMAAALARDRGYELYTTHRGTCPNAPAHWLARPNEGLVALYRPKPRQLKLTAT